jgi:putative transposase
MVGPGVKREAVAHLGAMMGLSERRACRIINVDRTSMRYRSRRPDDGILRSRLRALAHDRRRFGYRRLFILLRREGEAAGRNRVYRLYRVEGLSVRRRKARRRAVVNGTLNLTRVDRLWQLESDPPARSLQHCSLS